jgi:hypothetical protein
MTRAALLLLVVGAATAHAEPPPPDAPWKAAAAAFRNAVEKNDGEPLLGLWPAGGATLFGKKVQRAAAVAVLKKKNGVYRLLRWPADVNADEPGAAPPEDGFFEKDKHGGHVTLMPGSYGLIPKCTLAPDKTGRWELVTCKMVDTGEP